MKMIGELALLPWIGENIGVQNGIIYSFPVSNGEGKQAGMTFPMNPRSDGLSESVIGCMKDIWIVVSNRAKIKKSRIAGHGVECSLNGNFFMLKASIAE